MHIAYGQRTQRWVKPAIVGVLLFGIGCVLAWPGGNAGSEGVFHFPYVGELFGIALVAAALTERWRWRVAVVLILTVAQALVYVAAYPPDPLIPLGVVCASGIICGGVVAGMFFRGLWRDLKEIRELLKRR